MEISELVDRAESDYLTITHYQVSFHPPTNRYFVHIWLAGSSQPLQLPADSETEFTALFLMLQKSDVKLGKDSGALFVLARPVGT